VAKAWGFLFLKFGQNKQSEYEAEKTDQGGYFAESPEAMPEF